MARVVGKAVEDELGKRAAMDDKGGAVIAQGGKLREGALHRGRIMRRFDVVHAPVRVELLHVR